MAAKRGRLGSQGERSLLQVIRVIRDPPEGRASVSELSFQDPFVSFIPFYIVS